MRTELGKIKSANLGLGGYQNAQFGATFVLEGAGRGVGDFWGGWSLAVRVGEATKWKEEDRDAEFAQVMRRINSLLVDAKKQTLSELQGTPVEVAFDGIVLASWRILTEVI